MALTHYTKASVFLAKTLSSLRKRLSPQPRRPRNDEGFLAVPGGRVWYRRVESVRSSRFPLVVAHGGPGFPHNYLLPLERIAESRGVIFYDQLGCGQSVCKEDSALWTVARYTAELRALIRELAPEGAHVLGHSWGAILALEAGFLEPERIRSVVLASPSLSIPRWTEDSRRLRALLGTDVMRALDEGETKEEFDSPAYVEAVRAYYERFVHGAHGFHALVDEAARGRSEAIYRSLWGPNELLVNGSLRGYDALSRLGEIACPVLVTCGRWDEATPETGELIAKGARGKLRVFELSAHYPHLSEPAEYCRVLEEFLREVEE